MQTLIFRLAHPTVFGRFFGLLCTIHKFYVNSHGTTPGASWNRTQGARTKPIFWNRSELADHSANYTTVSAQNDRKTILTAQRHKYIPKAQNAHTSLIINAAHFLSRCNGEKGSRCRSISFYFCYFARMSPHTFFVFIYSPYTAII